MEVELLKTVSGGGGVVVCIALVILFLKHINSIHADNKQATRDMVDKFNEEHTETRKAFQSQITALTDQVFQMADRTTSALNEVKVAITELRSRIG